MLKNEDGSKCPLYWQTRKVRRVVKSTLAAEILALLDGAETVVYLPRMIAELKSSCPMAIKCFVDNKSLTESLYLSKHVENRQLRLNMAVIRYMLAREELHSVSWVDTASQLAYCLTKRGASTQRLRDAIAC